MEFAHDLDLLGVPLFRLGPGRVVKDRYAAPPPNWPDRTAAGNAQAIAAWEPGDALAAVGGPVMDALDFDLKHGGRETYCRMNAAGQLPPVLYSVATPGGGIHLYVDSLGLATSKPRANDPAELLPGLDYQGRGAFVLCPPTEDYRLLLNGDWPEGWDPLNPPTTGAADRFRRAIVGRYPSTPSQSVAAQVSRPPTQRELEKAQRVLEKSCREVRGAGQGGRNNTVSRQLLPLLGFVLTACLDEGEVKDRLWDASQEAPGVEPYTRAEFEASWDSAWKSDKLTPQYPQVDSPEEDFEPLDREPEADPTKPSLFADVAAFLSGGGPVAPPRNAGPRTDGEHLFYEGQVNVIFGDPESGKTWLALFAAAEALKNGQPVAFLDMDHNGLGATVERMRILGVGDAALVDPGVFRYVEPDDEQHLAAIVAALVRWQPAVAVVDSVGELLPLLGMSSNSPDDFTVAHAKALKPLARAGACVLAIDHLAKNTESRKAGPTGTAAKRRAVGGVSLRVVALDQFTPGRGGKAALSVNKDRHGAVRAVCPTGTREPSAGVFVMDTDDLGTRCIIAAPGADQGGGVVPPDVVALRELDPPPRTVRDVRDRMHWGAERAQRAMNQWRELEDEL